MTATKRKAATTVGHSRPGRGRLPGEVQRRPSKKAHAARQATIEAEQPQREALLLGLGYLNGVMLCRALRWAPKTLANKALADLPPMVKVGDCRLFPVAEFHRWLAARQVSA